MDTATVTPIKPKAITSRLDGLRRHKLLTAADARKLPALYATDGDTERTVWAKVFSPYIGQRHYLVEYDGVDIAFAYTTNADGTAEWGYVSLQELADCALRGKLPAFEADKWWKPTTIDRVISGAVS